MKNLGGSTVVLWRPLCSVAFLVLPLSVPIANERKQGQTLSHKERENDYTPCTLYSVLYWSEIQIPFNVSGIPSSVEDMLTFVL